LRLPVSLVCPRPKEFAGWWRQSYLECDPTEAWDWAKAVIRGEVESVRLCLLYLEKIKQILTEFDISGVTVNIVVACNVVLYLSNITYAFYIARIELYRFSYKWIMCGVDCRYYYHVLVNF
jgi:hypothetical protein